jgi:F0F1-type ATP synthase assembly protein I
VMIKHLLLITVFGPMMASRSMKRQVLLIQSVTNIAINAMFTRLWGNRCWIMLGKGIIAVCSLMVRRVVGNHTLW